MTTQLEQIIKAAQDSFGEKFYYDEKTNRLISRSAESYDSTIVGATHIDIKRFLSLIIPEAIKAAFEATAVESNTNNDERVLQKVREKQNELLK